MKAEVYTKENCIFCIRAIKLLEDHGIEHDIIDVNPLNKEELIARVEKATGTAPRTVPQIFIESEYVGGFDDLEKRLT